MRLLGLQLALAASARWLAAGVLAAQAAGSGLGHPATAPAPFCIVPVALAVRFAALASGVRGLRVPLTAEGFHFEFRSPWLHL